MTKDWDAVQDEIKELSFNQKKPLEEVKAIMEAKHKFRASTRAYRMKLAEWGFTRRTKTGGIGSMRSHQKPNGSGIDVDGISLGEQTDSEVTAEPISSMEAQELDTPPIIESHLDPTLSLLDGAEDLLPAATPSIDPWAQGGGIIDEIVMNMLRAVLEGNAKSLEELVVANPDHINMPIGLPFEAHAKFFNHPAMNQCVVLQHADQKLLDIACALPSGPVVWCLISNGAKGSRHPLGTDLALHNAIKNGRTFAVQSLLQSGDSDVNGLPGTPWKPLLQATFWNVPDVVRILLDKGANVNDAMPWLEGPLKTTLQFCLTRRTEKYSNHIVRERSEKILKMLLDAGATIDLPSSEASDKPFALFLQPWQGDPHWVAKVSATEMDCLEAFVRKGADLQTNFNGFPCGSIRGHTFEHQVLWHSTPKMARLFIDHAFPAPGSNGSNLLNEILGCCPDTKRHPAETLRDMEVLISRGADPNTPDINGDLPLRKVVERCPAVDIIPRLKALLDGGADPEIKGRNGVLPFVLAARSFDEPLMSQVMHLMVEKCRGKYTMTFHGITSTWSPDYLPIPSDPSFVQVMWYSGQNGDFMANLQRMVPQDMQSTFQRATFSVASKNFLDSTTKRAKMSLPLQLTAAEKDEIQQIISFRQSMGLPEYQFDQAFVMSLLMPPATLLLPHQTPISCTAATASNILATAPSHNLALPPSSQPLSRSSSSSSNASTSSFFVASTTQIRWPVIGRATRPSDVEKAKGALLKYRCKSCNDGNLLTREEYDRHEAEHWHTLTCDEPTCKRRFCVAERDERNLAD